MAERPNIGKEPSGQEAEDARADQPARAGRTMPPTMAWEAREAPEAPPASQRAPKRRRALSFRSGSWNAKRRPATPVTAFSESSGGQGVRQTLKQAGAPKPPKHALSPPTAHHPPSRPSARQGHLQGGGATCSSTVARQGHIQPARGTVFLVFGPGASWLPGLPAHLPLHRA